MPNPFLRENLVYSVLVWVGMTMLKLRHSNSKDKTYKLFKIYVTSFKKKTLFLANNFTPSWALSTPRWLLYIKLL